MTTKRLYTFKLPAAYLTPNSYLTLMHLAAQFIPSGYPTAIKVLADSFELLARHYDYHFASPLFLGFLPLFHVLTTGLGRSIVIFFFPDSFLRSLAKSLTRPHF